MVEIQFSIISEKGKRESNQDSATVISNKSKSTYLLVMADGMGGYKGGELASKLIINACQEVFDYHYGKNTKPEINMKQILNQVFQHSQDKITEAKKENTEYSGMGTTLACVLINNNKAVWGNIGDSRIYMINDTKVKLITKDHSLVQDYIDKHGGNIPQSYLAQYSNVLTKSIGGNSDMPDIFPVETEYYELYRGESEGFLLCSDGLIVNKSYDYSLFLQKSLSLNRTLDNSVQYLYDWAINNGSTDNISIILFNLHDKSKYFLGRNPNFRIVVENKIVKYGLILLLVISLSMIIKYQFFLERENNQTNNNTDNLTNSIIEPRGAWKGFSVTNNQTQIRYSLSNPKTYKIKWYNYQHPKDYRVDVFDIDGNILSKTKTSQTVISIKELGVNSIGIYTIKVRVLFNDGGEDILSPNSIKLEIID